MPLVRALAAHGVAWVMCGSCVLALHGAALAPNDLDIVPDLAPDNLERLARCLAKLEARPVPWDDPRSSVRDAAASRAWRPRPASAANLDHLFVTRHGMLDVVIAHVVRPPGADPYRSLLPGATLMRASGVEMLVCDPRRVLDALDGRPRHKDAARRAAYAAMRRRLGPSGSGRVEGPRPRPGE